MHEIDDKSTPLLTLLSLTPCHLGMRGHIISPTAPNTLIVDAVTESEPLLCHSLRLFQRVFFFFFENWEAPRLCLLHGY